MKKILSVAIALLVSTPVLASPVAEFFNSVADFQRQQQYHDVSLHPHYTGWKRHRLGPNFTIHSLVTEAAQRHGVPVGIAHGVIRIESGYNCGARNGAHYGLGQVAPATARSVGVTGNLFACQTGVEAAMRYLRLALARGGAGCAGVSLYNMGIYARPVCTSYGRKVMRMAG